MKISVESTGSFDKTNSFLKTLLKADPFSQLDSLAQKGVNALAAATPVETGLAAHSWSYEINKSKQGVTIAWINTDNEGGENVVILLQYGHGTGTGGYVQGRDFINPAMQPIFDEISTSVWKVVQTA